MKPSEIYLGRFPFGDIADDGMPAEFDICPLLHVVSIEPFSLHDSNPAA